MLVPGHSGDRRRERTSADWPGRCGGADRVGSGDLRGHVSPRPRRTARPSRSAARATVRAQGASSVTLVRGAEIYPVPGPVPEGTWQIKAVFKISPEDAGSVVVPASGTVSLICERSAHLCKRIRANLLRFFDFG